MNGWGHPLRGTPSVAKAKHEQKEITMEIKQVKLIYFSPTGTTQKVLESIAKGIAAQDVEHINLTLPEGAQQTIPPFSDELVIIGAPVTVVVCQLMQSIDSNS
jgi:hypothetical protein